MWFAVLVVGAYVIVGVVVLTGFTVCGQLGGQEPDAVGDDAAFITFLWPIVLIGVAAWGSTRVLGGLVNAILRRKAWRALDKAAKP
jgi:hypothetical protein